MNEWNRSEVTSVLNESRWTINKVFWKILVPILGLILLASAAFWTVRMVTAPAGVLEKMADSDNVIYNIEWFRKTAAEVGSYKQQIQNSSAALERFEAINGNPAGYNFKQSEEDARLATIVTGLKNQCSSLSAEYNARSKMVTRSMFKGTDLPEEVGCQ